MQRLPRPKRAWTDALTRHLGKATLAAWGLALVVDGLAFAKVIPWLPIQLHSLAIAALIVGTLTVVGYRWRTPVRAAFLDGMLYEREHGHDIELPQAAGDDTGAGAKVMAFQRSAGAHRRTPAPRPRPRG